MSSDHKLAIQVQNVTKTYKLYNKPLDRLKEAMFPFRKLQHKKFTAVNDISFKVNKGETLGIVGKNGSGKSTLLKMITGILTPTFGAIKVSGRISSLLELGAGFNPELTGIENIYLNGTIMGFSREEMDGKIEMILDFADIGNFINQPVKTYSSGMYVRLAFATAITVEPEILIVDEALAVGDVSFQNKCYRKFEQLKNKGITILFVTHAIELITRHCDRAILINDGNLLADGRPNEVVNMYMNLMTNGNSGLKKIESDTKQQTELFSEDRGDSNTFFSSKEELFMYRKSYNPAEYRWGDGRAKIVDYLLNINGEIEPAKIKTNCNVDLYVKYLFTDTVENLICGITLKTIDGIIIFAYSTRAEKIQIERKGPGEVFIVKFSFKLTAVTGTYTISIGCSENMQHMGQDHIAIDRRNDLIILEVFNDKEISGIIDPCMSFEECNIVLGDEKNDSQKSPANNFLPQ
jgi:ABC-type polysaccharide/polyol phosphate transport system ATPase subunit